MWTKKLSGSLLGVGVAAAAITAFSVVRRRARARRFAAIAARARSERWVGIGDDMDPSQLDSEDLQWRPRTGSSLAGPEDLEQLDLNFDELEETDVASASVTIDMIGGGADEGVMIDAGSGGGEPSNNPKGRSDREGKSQRSNAPRPIDELDFIDELDDPQQPPHRYR